MHSINIIFVCIGVTAANPLGFASDDERRFCVLSDSSLREAAAQVILPVRAVEPIAVERIDTFRPRRSCPAALATLRPRRLYGRKTSWLSVRT